MKFRLTLPLILSSVSLAITTCTGDEQMNNLRRRLESEPLEYKKIKTSINGECVMVKQYEGNVVTGSCSDEEWFKKGWIYNSETQQFENAYSNECLDVSQTKKNQVITWACHGDTNQQWEYDSFNKRFMSIENGKCMHLIDSNNIQVSYCDNSDSQKFYLEKVTIEPPSTKGTQIKNEVDCVEMSLSSRNNVSLQSCNNLNQQKWYYDSTNKAFKSSENDYCLDVNEDDGNVHAWPCHYSRNQQWEWIYDNSLNYHKLKSKSLNGDKCLDTDQSNNMMVNICSGIGQKFTHTSAKTVAPTKQSPTKSPSKSPTKSSIQQSPVDSLVNKSFSITNGDRCVGVISRNSDDIDVAMQYCDGEENQNWIYSKGTMKNIYSNKCLDVNLSNEQEIVIAWNECHGDPNQLWVMSSRGMESNYNGKCVTVEDNMSLRLYPCNGNPNQQFNHKGYTPPQGYVVFGDVINGCLEMTSSGDVVSAKCTTDHNQQWLMDNLTKTIKNRSNKWCLDVNQQGGNNIIAWKECHGRDNQQWTLYEGNVLKSMLSDSKKMVANLNLPLKSFELQEYKDYNTQKFQMLYVYEYN